MPRNKSNQGCKKTLHSKLRNIAKENVKDLNKWRGMPIVDWKTHSFFLNAHSPQIGSYIECSPSQNSTG